MSVEVIAKKDFEDAVRSRWLLGLAALFVLLAAAFMAVGAYFLRTGDGGTFSSSTVLNFMNGGFVTGLVPLIALVVSYSAIVGERESGSLKLLLSLPHSRADVVFGKVIGRTAAVAVPLFFGFLIPALIAAIGPLQFELVEYVAYLLLMIVLAAVFVAIAVGFSAAVGSNQLAVAGAVGIYFLFVFVIGGIRGAVGFLFALGGKPDWFPLAVSDFQLLLRLISPTGSFKIVSGEFLRGSLFVTGSEPGRQILSTEVAAVAMLAAWILLPPLLGLLRFEKEDL
jgi:ABC-2 type transport system permease protein